MLFHDYANKRLLWLLKEKLKTHILTASVALPSPRAIAASNNSVLLFNERYSSKEYG
jgi:hypothetical protein